jgi:hypothetical protein
VTSQNPVTFRRGLVGWFGNDADPEFEQTFTAYHGYATDVSSLLNQQFGPTKDRRANITYSVLTLDAVQRLDRHKPEAPQLDLIDRSLRRSWQSVRRAQRELDFGDITDFDPDANALLPVIAYYGAFHAVRTVLLALNWNVPSDHRPVLNAASDLIARGYLPYPWSGRCLGSTTCETIAFDGFPRPPATVHVLSTRSTGEAIDGYANFLRTTRDKELEFRFKSASKRNVTKGRTRRNIKRDEKVRIADKLAPTTIFDLLWRMRKKANYADADAFVLGPKTLGEASEFAAGLAETMDATVCATTAIVARRLGVNVVERMLDQYVQRCRTPDGLEHHLHALSTNK